MKIALILLLLLLALASPRFKFLGSLTFALWVSLFVAAAVSYPFIFGTWFGINLQVMIVPLIQIIMFGMGTTLSIRDFRMVLKMPLPVFIGMILQYSVMPLTGFLLAHLFSLSPEIAAGVILVGCCPGGVASNLMAYIARGNVALSVTMTACSTLASPLMTPFLMEKLAGELIPIPFFSMMVSIFDMIIIPIVTGILAHGILYGSVGLYRNRGFLLLLGSGALLPAGILVFLFDSPTLSFLAPLRGGLILGSVLLASTCFFKALTPGREGDVTELVDRALPFISMSGICLILAIITSRSVDQLKTAGLLLVIVSGLHCFMGFTTGYWLGRIAGLSRRDCRTISFEVGMQNSGMASGLAISVLDNIITALPPAIFGPLMNISGSVLAYCWGSGKKDKPQ